MTKVFPVRNQRTIDPFPRLEVEGAGTWQKAAGSLWEAEHGSGPLRFCLLQPASEAVGNNPTVGPWRCLHWLPLQNTAWNLCGQRKEGMALKGRFTGRGFCTGIKSGSREM